MILRKHQAETASLAQRILSGEKIPRIYESVTPGGGKSALPGILADALIPAIADRILWVVPRNSLRDQGERDFPEWSKHRIRSAGGESDPCRGTQGYVTTYQAIVSDPGRHLANVSDGHHWIVLLDEFHHVAEGGEWHRALAPIVDKAVLFMPMSGTLSRGDGQPIAWLDYGLDGLPVFADPVVRYSRTDALRDRAIVPVHFRYLDGHSEWEDEAGERREADISTGDYSPQALFTALRTEYAYQLLDETVAHWQKYRVTEYERAKLIVVAPNIEYAGLYQDHLHRRGVEALIATSDDDAKAREAIARFKGQASPFCDALVTVQMAYEGLSVPEITHIACLTHIRSIPWLEQLFARGNRNAPGKREAFVFGPKDHRLRKAVRDIEREQAQALKDQVEDSGAGGSEEAGEGGTGKAKPWITPIGSEAYTADPAPGMTICMGAKPDGGLTPREAERLLRKQIADHIETFLSDTRPGSKPAYQKIIHRKLKDLVGGKAREDCTVAELSKQFAFMKAQFPIVRR